MSTASDPTWFDLAPCGLLSTTLDGIVVEANETFLAWTGFAASDVVGSQFSNLLDRGSRLFYESRHSEVVRLRGEAHDVAFTLLTATGASLPVLVNSSLDAEAARIRTAVFNASERRRYERELVHARRAAEASEKRVRVLQDISTAFGVSASDEEVAEAFATVAREAFAARETAVLLVDEQGELTMVGGTNPLGTLLPEVASHPSSVVTSFVTMVTEATAPAHLPELPAQMRAARVSALTVAPLIGDSGLLGVLVCFFGRRRQFDDHFYELQKALARQASQTLVRVRLQRRLAFLALHDQLTGAANRELVQQGLEEAIEASITDGVPLSVVFLDVDDFKSVNDAHGHAVGDRVLVELAARLRTGVRGSDIVGRVGGDEFVAVCPGADWEDAQVIAERILESTRQPILAHGAAVSASVSVGVSLYRPWEDARPTAEQLLTRADVAMYESKGAGKNRATLGRLAG